MKEAYDYKMEEIMQISCINPSRKICENVTLITNA